MRLTGTPAASRLRAFTLLELLLAASISVLLAGLLLAVVNQVVTFWHRTQSDLTTSAQAALAIDLLASDLQSAIVLQGAEAWMAADLIDSTGELQRHGWNLQGTLKPGAPESTRLPAVGVDPATARFGRSGVWLRFLTTKPDTHEDSRRASAPAAVSYQIVRRADARGQLRYELCRSLVRQSTTVSGAPGTFDSGYDLISGRYAIASSTAGDPGTVLTPASIDTLAVNVVDFGVQIYHRDSNGNLTCDFPSASSTSYRVAQGQAAPSVVDVFIRTVSDEGAAQLANLEAGRVAPPQNRTFAETWWEIADAHSSVATRRIEIKAHE